VAVYDKKKIRSDMINTKKREERNRQNTPMRESVVIAKIS